MTTRPTVYSRQTVEEDDRENLGIDGTQYEGDEYSQNRDEYDDVVADSLNSYDDQQNLLFKSIIKREGGFKSFGARDSVLSADGRRSYTNRFSSKYGDNRLYL